MLHLLFTEDRKNSIALKYKNQDISYSQMHDQVMRFKKYFQDQGIGQGENVGLFCHNSAEFIYAYFAIVSLGSVVVPINFMLTPREVSFIVEDAGIKNLVTKQHIDLAQEINQMVLAEFLPLLPDLVVTADSGELAFDQKKECVIIYTSGTTGFPKGAVLSFENIISNAGAIGEVLQMSEKDNSLCVLPMFHSFAWTVAVMAALLKGACVTIMAAFLPKDVINTIREQGVTVVCGVPAMYNYYVSLGTAEDFAGIRVFVSGGASLPVEIMNQFRQKIGKPIMEGYGLSEASPVVTMNPLSRGKIGSIGMPLAGIEIRIVDADGQDLPPGKIGELITRGPNVMKGYFHLPEETEKAVVDGWLHTGDLAYADEDGYYFIVDRLKDIIIVGGLNIYPREIEEIIYQYPGIREAAVIGINDPVRGEIVSAYIVLQEDAEFVKKDFKSFLQKNLAHYKLPKKIIQLAELPKNATGKIMKKELKQQGDDHQKASHTANNL